MTSRWTRPGVWTVDLLATFDGRTSAGQVTEPYPTGEVLGSEDGRYYFYVVDAGREPLDVDLPRRSLFQPRDQEHREGEYSIDIEALLPDDYTAVGAHVTTMMPGTILESRELVDSLVYTLNVNELGMEVPNLDWEKGLADLLTTSIYVEAEDDEGNTHHLGRVINFHGAEIFALDVPVPDEAPFAITSGLTDAWYNPDTDGQGFLIIVFEEIESIFMAWFTYDTAASEGEADFGDADHRWLTAFGKYSGDTAVLEVVSSSNGQFDTAPMCKGKWSVASPSPSMTVSQERWTTTSLRLINRGK